MLWEACTHLLKALISRCWLSQRGRTGDGSELAEALSFLGIAELWEKFRHPKATAAEKNSR